MELIETEELKKIARHLPTDFDEGLIRDAKLFLAACIVAVCDPIDGPRMAVRFLDKIEEEYACWLESVQDAIHASRGDFSDWLAADLDRLEGAADMANVYLLKRAYVERP